MRRAFYPLLIVLIALMGCEKEPEKPALPPPPPPPTPEEIAQKFIKDQTLDAPVSPGQTIQPAAAGQFVQAIRAFATDNSRTPEGARAVPIVSKAVDDRLRQNEGAANWEMVLVLCDAHEALNPKSTKFARIREQAIIELRRPKVTFTGFSETNGQKKAWLTFRMALKGEEFKEKLAVGEEAHGIRVIGIVGNDRGVELEYLETGDKWQAVLDRFKD